MRGGECKDQAVGLVTIQSQQFKERGKIGWEDQFNCAYSVLGKYQLILRLPKEKPLV